MLRYKSHLRRVAMTILWFCAQGIGQRPALQNRGLAIDDVLGARSFGQLLPLALSPNGASVAYTVQQTPRTRSIDREAYFQTGVPRWAWGTDIYLTRIETGETKNLTGGSGNNWLPAWSPDGRYIAFLSDRGGRREGEVVGLGRSKEFNGESIRRSDQRIKSNGVQTVTKYSLPLFLMNSPMRIM